jgi:pSer/pThr/pTyr-binding forkhead associated (FHA) protein
MPALILNLLKILFLVLLFVFLWQIAGAIRAHIGRGASATRGRDPSELVVVRGDASQGKRVKLRGSGHTIGRSPDADVIIDDPYASDFHARVTSQNEQTRVEDLGSTNGTYVNGRRITAPTPLARGDTIQIGKTMLEAR